jgi:hypothetical protein
MHAEGVDVGYQGVNMGTVGTCCKRRELIHVQDGGPEVWKV